MSDLSSKPVHSSGVIDDFFFIEGHMLSTRSADAYKAIDKVTKESVSLWRLRHPLALNSDAMNRFLGRMERITSLNPPVAQIDSYEIDSQGTAFIVMPPLSGDPLTLGRLDPGGAERQFTACLRLIAQLHDADIVCGDICNSSFWIDRSGDLCFIGVVGCYDGDAAATSVMPPAETLQFLAPELRTGISAELASDVFSLGVLGYILFTGQAPYSAQAVQTGKYVSSDLKPVSTIYPKAPPWADELFTKCLQPKAEDRYRSVSELLQALNDLRQRNLEAASAPARIGSMTNVQDRARANSTLHAPVSTSARNQQKPVEEPVQEQKSGKGKLIAVMAVVFLITLGIAYRLHQSVEPTENKLQTDLKAHLEAVDNEQLTQAIVDIAQPQLALEEKAKQLDKIANSEDPLAHDILLRTALDAPTEEERQLAEKVILARAQRLGLARTSEQVRQWLRASAGNTGKPAAYTSMLKALNTNLPADVRSGLLKEAYTSNPRIVLRVVAAMAIDTGKPQDFQPLLADLLQAPLEGENLKTRSTVSLILAYSDLATVFSEDVWSFKDTIPDADVMWLMKILADRSDLQLQQLALLAAERQILSPLRQIFMGPLTSRPNLPIEVTRSLIKASAGALKKEDITPFGRWFDSEVEKILLTICADQYGRDILIEAFDILAGKNPTLEPTATIISWIRRDYWEQRGDFIHALGVLGALNVMSIEEVRRAVASFDRFSNDPRFIKGLLSTNHPLVMKVLLDRYTSRIGLIELIKLLEFPDKEIRLLAIKALAPYNDINALKLVIEHYEKEKDPEVRKLYETVFWVIRERAPAAK